VVLQEVRPVQGNQGIPTDYVSNFRIRRRSTMSSTFPYWTDMSNPFPVNNLDRAIHSLQYLPGTQAKKNGRPTAISTENLENANELVAEYHCENPRAQRSKPRRRSSPTIAWRRDILEEPECSPN